MGPANNNSAATAVLQELKPVLTLDCGNAQVSAGLSWLKIQTGDGRTFRFAGQESLKMLLAFLGRCIDASYDKKLKLSGESWHQQEEISDQLVELSFVINRSYQSLNCDQVRLYITGPASSTAGEEKADFIPVPLVKELENWLALALGQSERATAPIDLTMRLASEAAINGVVLRVYSRSSEASLIHEVLSHADAIRLQQTLLAAATDCSGAEHKLVIRPGGHGTVLVTAGDSCSHPRINISNDMGSRSCVLSAFELIRLALAIGILLQERQAITPANNKPKGMYL